MGEAVFTDRSQTFSYSPAIDTPTGFNSFFAPKRQFCANSLSAPSGCFVNGTGVTQNLSGSSSMIIDHNQGRVLLNSSYGTGVTVSGNFFEKEVNIYMTNDAPEDIIISNDFIVTGTPRTTYLQSSGELGVRRFVLPATFITYDTSKNEPFAFGGIEDTVNNVRVLVVATNNYEIDGVLSLFKDSAHKSFKIIDYEDYPYGQFWHVKTPPYYYPSLMTGEAANASYAYIERVDAYKIKDSINRKIGKALLFGFLDFRVSSIREVPC